MKWLGYGWRVLANLFYLVVVVAVLAGIRDPGEKSIIAVLGLIYVTVRSTAIGQGLGSMASAASLQQQLDQIRYRVDGAFGLPDRSEENTAMNTARAKLLIDAFFLGIVSLVCLGFFVTAHG
jgi:hypothetical protein